MLYFVTILLIAVLLFALELCYFRLADRFNIVDKPNERSSHSTITLRGGGIIFPIAGVLYFCFFGCVYPLFLIGLLLIAAVSFVDDVQPLPNRIRITVHFIALFLMFVQWEFPLQYPWFVPLALIFCAGIINAWNFMDGINGITGGYSFVVLTGLAFVNSFQREFVDANLINVVLLSLIVFNFFNFRTKAKCFAGDVGAVTIAFVIVFVLGLLMFTEGDGSAICFVAVYGVDSVMTILYRLMLRENIFKPHRRHLYQLLANERRIPHIYVSLLYSAVQAAIIGGYLLCRPHGATAAWSYTAVVLAVLVGIYILIRVSFRRG